MTNEDIKRFKDAILERFEKELDANLLNLEDNEKLETSVCIATCIDVDEKTGYRPNTRENSFEISILCKNDNKIEPIVDNPEYPGE